MLKSTETVKASDLLAVVFNYFLEKKTNRFHADPASFHQIFYNWREKNKDNKRLYQVLVFDTRERFPFSETLENGLDALQFSGYLERTNPRGVFVEVDQKIKKLYAEIKKQFTADELERLTALAEELSQKLNSNEKNKAPLYS